jgi:hypothetical protein
MIPDYNDKLTQRLLSDGVPEWNNPGFTDRLMRQIAAAENRKTRRRFILLSSAFVTAIALTGFSLVSLARLKSSALSGPVGAFEQVGDWIGGKAYIIFPLVLLLLTKRLIDSHFRANRSANQ